MCVMVKFSDICLTLEKFPELELWPERELNEEPYVRESDFTFIPNSNLFAFCEMAVQFEL